MGSSLSAVESLIHRAKSNLRKNLRMWILGFFTNTDV
jgi:DNA-directed RNA polymerase specialized sigma24 family protein